MLVLSRLRRAFAVQVDVFHVSLLKSKHAQVGAVGKRGAAPQTVPGLPTLSYLKGQTEQEATVEKERGQLRWCVGGAP